MSSSNRSINVVHAWEQYNRSHSPKEVEQLSRRLRRLVWRQRLRSYVRILLPIVGMIAVVIALFQSDAVETCFLTTFRLVLVHAVFPIVNLPRLGSMDCLVSNPNFNNSMIAVNVEDCHRCHGIKRAVTIDGANFSRSNFIDSVADQDTPVIIRGGVQDWPLSSVSLQHLHDLYVHDVSLRHTLPCSLHSTVDLPFPNNKLLLKMVLDEKPRRWFAMWEHCTINQTKTFRQFYKRPHFLPDTLGFGGPELHNWLVVGQNPKIDEDPEPLLYRVGGYVFLGQARGRMRVRLEPKEPCLEEKKCEAMSMELMQGDLLIATGLWYLKVIPTGPGLSLALAFLADS